jgi:uncharacterized membrane protein SpoIIM required for sporulation
MKPKLIIFIELILFLVFLFSAFQIVNISALHKDQVSFARTMMEIENNDTRDEIAKIDAIDWKLSKHIKRFKISALISGVLVIGFPIVAMTYRRRNVQQNV